ncbi:MAG: Na(+)/H(+) antiporter subunit B [Pirellulaceae bacterium]
MISFPVIRVITKLIIPYILLFALYVQFHGDFGPGGGFQAGVIFASALILYGLVFGLPAAQRVAPPRLIEKMIAIGVLTYAGTGVVTMLMGGNFLDYDVLQFGGQQHVAADADHNPSTLPDGGATLDSHEENQPPETGNHESESAHEDEHSDDHGGAHEGEHEEHGFFPQGQHLGIFIVELGVGITVTSVMTMIFYCFAGREQDA